MLRRKSNPHLSSLNFVYKDLKIISKPIPSNKHKHALKRAKKVSLGISVVTKILIPPACGRLAGFSGLWISNYLRCAVPFMTHFYIWSIITYNHLQINQSQLAIRGCFQYRAQRNCLWMSQRIPMSTKVDLVSSFAPPKAHFLQIVKKGGLLLCVTRHQNLRIEKKM